MQEPISLYFDLAPGTRADIEVVSRSAISFSAALKEIAYILEPSIHIRIEIESGTEGSLSLNSLLRAIGVVSPNAQARLTAVVRATALWLTLDATSWFLSQVYEYLFPAEEVSNLTDADKDAIAEIVKKALDSKVAQAEVRNIYEEASKDPNIVGIGVSTIPGVRPPFVVPRSEFASRAGSNDQVELLETRTRTSREAVTLISPVLLEGGRRWKFSSREGTFGAPVRDTEFIRRVLSGQTAIKMMAGIVLDVWLETKEEKEGGAWVVKERNILQVFGATQPPSQTSLDLPSPTENPDN